MCNPVQRRRPRRVVLFVLASAVAALALAGCTKLDGPAAQLEVADVAGNPTLLVATTRKPADDASAERFFGSERATKMSVARAKLTPPAEGRLSLPAMTSE